MADTIRGSFPGSRCSDCDRVECVLSHWGDAVPSGKVGYFCGPCFRVRDYEAKYGYPTRDFGEKSPITERIVLYSEEQGVFLGIALGLGFWSQWDPLDQPAITCASVDEWSALIADWETPPPNDHQFRRVFCAGTYATKQEIGRAGLPIW